MNKELEKTLAERVKEYLQLDKEHSLFELAAMLREHRNNMHPDKFQDETLKVQAEARFKDANALLEELDRQLEVERLNAKPAALMLYKPMYEAVELQRKLEKCQGELEETKSELAAALEQNEALSQELHAKRNDALEKEIEHLRATYSPSPQSYASIGLGILMTGTLGILSKMESVSNLLEKYAPFDKQYISKALFFFMLLFLVEMLRKLWERSYIRRKSVEVCSPKSAEEFVEYLRKKQAPNAPLLDFSEIDVFDFIAGERPKLRQFASLLGFSILTRETINRLKDIFIHSALNKKLIEVSRAEAMQRYFKILSTRPDYLWYHEYITNQEKSKGPQSSGETA